MKVCLATVALLFAGSVATAQTIDVYTNLGPSGTHFYIQEAASSYTYECWTSCQFAYRHEFKVWHNSTLKHSEVNDVLVFVTPTRFTRNISFSGWNLRAGDVVTFYSKCSFINPDMSPSDEDYLYGDVTAAQGDGRAPSNRGWYAAAPPAAIDEKRRFESLFA